MTNDASPVISTKDVEFLRFDHPDFRWGKKVQVLTHFMPFIESERGCPYQKPWVEKAEAEIAAAQQGKGE